MDNSKNPNESLANLIESIKWTVDTKLCVQSALRSLKLIFIEHEDLLLGSGMRHDLTNLWNCSEYIDGLAEALQKYEEALAWEAKDDEVRSHRG